MHKNMGILFVPAMDRQNAWGGVWIRCHAGAIEGICEKLGDNTGSFHMLIDSNDGLPDACVQALPQGRTRMVLRDGVAQNGNSIVYGRELAAETHDAAQFDAAKAAGAQWFCGKFVSHPPVKSHPADASRSTLLKLLTLVAQDADIAEIEQVFKREPALSFNLFRLVNSVSMGLSTKISTFGQAIMVLGRRQMQRWIQLMLYTSKDGQEGPNPLLQLAAMRARLMERLASASGSDAGEQERAFMAGIFSLLDSLLGMPMDEIVKTIPVPDDVQAALLGNGGKLSEMLDWVEQLQAGIDAPIPQVLAALGPEALIDCQLEAVRWAAGIGQEMS